MNGKLQRRYGRMMMILQTKNKPEFISLFVSQMRVNHLTKRKAPPEGDAQKYSYGAGGSLNFSITTLAVMQVTAKTSSRLSIFTFTSIGFFLSGVCPFDTLSL